jgi:predicted PurR-regulated permease PerM
VVIWLIIPPFIEQFQDLAALFPAGLQHIQEGINWLKIEFWEKIHQKFQISRD